MGDRSLLKNFVEKFMGTVHFGNNHFEAIIGYGDYVQGNITVCHVYYVEGLGHNLFSVGQFYDGDLEVVFYSKTCYVRKREGDDLLTGDRESNLYTISISDMAASSLVCLMSKATSTKSWLWHRRLSHLNFGSINDLTKFDLVDGLLKFQYRKDHLCSTCERGKSKKASHPPKLVPKDLDNLFGPMYEEYFKKRSFETSINSAAQQVHNHKDSPLTSSIVVKEHEAPPILTTSDEQTSQISLNEADESNQKESIDFDGNMVFVPYDVPNFEEAESSTIALDPSNMHEFHQKHGMDESVSMSTPIATKRLDADLKGTPTDQTTYHQMIGGIMYLTASRLDIASVTFVCARYQAHPMVKHLKEVKRIFWYLRQSYNIGLWYPKDSGFELISYNEDHARCKDDCKSTSGGIQFLGEKLVSWSLKKTEYQLAYLFTKALPKERFEYLVHRIVKEHLIAEEIKKLVEGANNVENVEDDSSTLKKDDTQTILGTRLEPRSNKESPEVEITATKQPTNVIE
uniref:Uncharacterized mitochondrial protein AtMg00810-like n=1 Tax=Tanacetum cinerariifolium TaxID=118510 RepID=A0A6L2NS01_TANCI|nr:uncharacterized mitochondrial protein AtMg00810-like [Tanacetum cinerariifolium]